MGLSNANDWPNLIQTIRDHVDAAQAAKPEPTENEEER